MHQKIRGAKKIYGVAFFSNWRKRNELLEIQSEGPSYTWTNNCKEFEIILEALDRVHGDKMWHNIHPEAITQCLPRILFDHIPLILDTSPHNRDRKRPYKLEAWAMSFDETKNLIDVDNHK